jgi:hypothetical protein
MWTGRQWSRKPASRSRNNRQCRRNRGENYISQRTLKWFLSIIYVQHVAAASADQNMMVTEPIFARAEVSTAHLLRVQVFWGLKMYCWVRVSWCSFEISESVFWDFNGMSRSTKPMTVSHPWWPGPSSTYFKGILDSFHQQNTYLFGYIQTKDKKQLYPKQINTKLHEGSSSWVPCLRKQSGNQSVRLSDSPWSTKV